MKVYVLQAVAFKGEPTEYKNIWDIYTTRDLAEAEAAQWMGDFVIEEYEVLGKLEYK